MKNKKIIYTIFVTLLISVVSMVNVGMTSAEKINVETESETSSSLNHFEIDLHEGENLVTIPLDVDLMASDLFSQIPNCEVVGKWKTDSQKWQYYTGNGFDFSIEEGKGYNVHVSQPSELSISGEKIKIVNVPLENGINSLGWIENTDILASELLDRVPDCETLWGYNADTGSYQEYPPSNPWDGNDFVIEQGRGYMVEINTSEDNLVSFGMSLEPGTNMVGLPIESNMMASDLFSQIPNCEMVAKWKTDSQRWQYYTGNGFDFLIESGMGFCVYVEEESYLNVFGKQLVDYEYPVFPEQNLLSYYESESTSASAVLDNVDGCIGVLILKTLSNGTVRWKNYQDSSDEDFTIHQGMGYFVDLNGFSFDLLKGWNMIGLPVETDMMASDLGDLIPNCDAVGYFNPELQKLRNYFPDDGDMDFQIEDGMGLFVHVTKDTTFSVTGDELVDDDYPILPGNNMLSYYSDESTTASELMENTDGCIKVSIFDSNTQKEVVYQDSSDEDFTISKGMGYFITIEEDQPPVKPECEIEILRGDGKANLEISNVGDVDVKNLEWGISVEGIATQGLFSFVNVDLVYDGVVGKVSTGGSQVVSTPEDSLDYKVGLVTISASVSVEQPDGSSEELTKEALALVLRDNVLILRNL